MTRKLIDQVTSEIGVVLRNVPEQTLLQITVEVRKARRIVVHGAGRVGLACKGFAMRLGHLGFDAYTVADSTVPSIGKEDLLILASSSGETQTVYDVGGMARNQGTRVVVITAAQQSRVAGLADVLLVLDTPTKFGPGEGRKSIQPMATLFEQCLQILFDVLVVELMHETRQTHDDLWSRHSNLD